MLRHRAHVVHGIVNGVDSAVWNPENDAVLPQTLQRGAIEMRLLNKIALQNQHGPRAGVGRPAVRRRLPNFSQKGLDLLLDALPALFEQGGQLALLGSGDRILNRAFAAAAAGAGRRGRLHFRL